MKKYLGFICLLYSGIIIYVWYTGLLNNFLAPNMQMYVKLSSIILIIIGLIIIIGNIHYHFKISDLILLLPLIMLILAGNGRLTESLSSNRSSIRKDNATKTNEIIEVELEEKEEYDFTNPDFNVEDIGYSELADYISYAPKATKFIGKTIRVRGFSQKYASYIPEGYFTIGKYSITCCAADAGFVGFFIKYDTDLIKSYKWYEIEGVLKQGKDADGYDILYIDAINVTEISSNDEEQYIYPCYNYGNNACNSLDKYNLEY